MNGLSHLLTTNKLRTTKITYIMQQYTILLCHSQSENVANWQAEITKFTDAKAVVWYYDKIEFLNITGEWTGRDVSEIVRLRIFDAEKELHVWQTNGTLKARLRTDNTGEGAEFVEARQILNGTTFNGENGDITATEDKGICYHLPFVIENYKAGMSKRIALVTRNYIDYSDIGQAGYVDSRFVQFEIF